MIEGHRPKTVEVCKECGVSAGLHRQSCSKHRELLLKDLAGAREDCQSLEKLVLRLKGELRRLEAVNSVLKSTIHNLKQASEETTGEKTQASV